MDLVSNAVGIKWVEGAGQDAKTTMAGVCAAKKLERKHCRYEPKEPRLAGDADELDTFS